ncbi:MAG: hypothetical protein HC876_22630, partial [Chloroflexaceae bacterium]|nr:hypothetical protein [Chloroflexaceae bacterium]
MADTSKDKQHKGRGTPAQQKPTRRVPAQQVEKSGQDERHSISTKKQREEHQQQLIVRSVIVGVSIALFAMIVGILYDQVWVPAQALAQVNDTKLTRRAYWQTYRGRTGTANCAEFATG